MLVLAKAGGREKFVEILKKGASEAATLGTQNAADIGFATVCFTDYAAASAFNPKLKMIRSKTLMQGHDCCNHRYVMEG